MNRILHYLIRGAIAFTLTASLLLYTSPVQAAQPPATETLPQVLSASSASLSPQIPADIGIPLSLEKNLLASGGLSRLQAWFDDFSWQEFVAINWPVGSQGNPQPNITDGGTPQWATWHESLQVFRPDGSDPQNDTPRLCPQNSRKLRELYVTSSVFSNTVDSDIADERNQAFTTPLYDQNGNEARYEILLNEPEYKYIVENKLYNLDGQIEYSQTNHAPVKFPSGNSATGEVGAIEIKLAWKELSDLDSPSRFYTQTVLLPKLDNNGEPITNSDGSFKSCTEQLVGLVGMHIAQKTNSSPQWIWSTFEHVDNLNVNDNEFSSDGKPLYALFHDYSIPGQTLPINVAPIPRDTNTGKPSAKGIKKTQVARLIPIPGLAQQINTIYQQALAGAGSPLQYYELIDTQWPTAPYPDFTNYAAVAGSPFPGNLPEAIINKSTGAPVPVYLTNSIMETYFQAGNQPAHFQENGFPFVNTSVFGTESCMACHFSAGIASGYEVKNTNGKEIKVPIFGGDLTGDFSWLLQQKAQFKEQEKVFKRALAR
jgi:hypothetical protein